jgi:diguanylate cyclase (GGDEF)-like protein
MVLRARLEARGYVVESAEDGEEALAKIHASPPDLVLLDVMMPKLDGFEVVRRMKSDASLPFIPVIMQTALDSTESMVQGVEAGADDYIAKPINFKELEARVTSLLRIQALQQALEERERELSEANERLTVMSTTDALTELHNRRYLEERMHEMWEHSQRLHEPMAIVLCDIDHFKRVNDTYGHDVGDLVIKGFADVLKRVKRDTDAVGRFGGEEFVIVCEETDERGAMLLGERIRSELEATSFHTELGAIQVTCSVGAALFPLAGQSWEALFKSTDEALYASKRGGRNRVTLWTPKLQGCAA